MLNLQDFIAGSKLFRKFNVDELLFAEYKCPVSDSDTEVWWHNNFFMYILTGKVVLKTPDREYVFTAGDCAYARKGSVVARSHINEDLCELLIFVPDDFIKSVVQKHRLTVISEIPAGKTERIIPLAPDHSLSMYFQSLLTYFNQAEPPSEALLRIKFEELIVYILSAHTDHTQLKSCFRELCTSARPSIREIMEENFLSNLSMEEFARLCARSLSTFKLEFKKIFHITPARWLLEKRLEYSRFLLKTTDSNIDEICTTCGFENMSHFIRVFKSKYNLPPGKFKKTESVA
jgi:AraC-like DNA-binding protein